MLAKDLQLDRNTFDPLKWWADNGSYFPAHSIAVQVLFTCTLKQKQSARVFNKNVSLLDLNIEADLPFINEIQAEDGDDVELLGDYEENGQ